MNTLNLARKWRPERFDDMVGQEIAVRMIKNSLYRGHYFPVYLFSGQRGCGKTTAARIFAAAINCTRLALFKKNPTTEQVPCTECASCLAMKQGDHPDFVEVDAASHTGVDNVRQLIESAAFLPVMGSKKVYLIDEVHMLSKAACNALLKILEEPPSSALFILATTDPQKMIETIRSRCFHLFFMSIDTKKLGDYLELICQKEQISYERSGLDAIVKESEGCARDALNLLEQARFAHTTVTEEIVITILGHVSDAQIVELITILFARDQKQLVVRMPSILATSSAVNYVWRRTIELLRGIIWLKHKVVPAHLSLPESLPMLASQVSFELVHELLTHLYLYQDRYSKLTPHHVWLEIAFLQWCAPENKTNGSSNNGSNESMHSRVAIAPDVVQNVTSLLRDQKPLHNSLGNGKEIKQEQSSAWKQCIQQIEASDDRLVISILNQVQAVLFDEANNVLRLSFAKEKSFFKDLLLQNAGEWHVFVRAVYGEKVKIDCSFDLELETLPQASKEERVLEKKEIDQVRPSVIDQSKKMSELKSSEKKNVMRQDYSNTKKRESGYQKQDKGVVLDVSDRAQWPIASMISDCFPGTITILKEDQHGIS